MAVQAMPSRYSFGGSHADGHVFTTMPPSPHDPQPRGSYYYPDMQQPFSHGFSHYQSVPLASPPSHQYYGMPMSSPTSVEPRTNLLTATSSSAQQYSMPTKASSPRDSFSHIPPIKTELPVHFPSQRMHSSHESSLSLEAASKKKKSSKSGSDPGSKADGSTAGPAPGPIPATTPLVVKVDDHGVQWIAFDYSRDRVTKKYTMRCDVDMVALDNLSPEFKSHNCVYPRAHKAKMREEEYTGNRLAYETECNDIGWALTHLNRELEGKRGLIQRAVDSWRNSNANPKLRSRRVRRQNKMSSRKERRDSLVTSPTMSRAGDHYGHPSSTIIDMYNMGPDSLQSSYASYLPHMSAPLDHHSPVLSHHDGLPMMYSAH